MSGGNGGNTPFVTVVGRAGADGMVERVARAIEATSSYVISQHHAKALARAAIAAMREPTEAMWEAGKLRWHEGGDWQTPAHLYLEDVATGILVWQRAIDAALREEK